ncbi:hypothetical protein [Deinococcus sp. NW-56]|uniref:hypothetical protein n=1 Tax=Deinococcus sp. NW-56 TaxID=2080419 RepID=UPI001319D1FF|nr:hypothetical protein [Deinococcus sp. NW-56]
MQDLQTIDRVRRLREAVFNSMRWNSGDRAKEANAILDNLLTIHAEDGHLDGVVVNSSVSNDIGEACALAARYIEEAISVFVDDEAFSAAENEALLNRVRSLLTPVDDWLDQVEPDYLRPCGSPSRRGVHALTHTPAPSYGDGAA